MKTIHEITIKSNVSTEYATTVSVIELVGLIYYVIIKTNHKGVINEFEQRCDTYKEALHQFLEDVNEYANHTALMNI